mmetsp:Transcript_30521/g.47435  ORF Transcript_30521/g.47435 Transcript_30521/m.47435 type:complete len:192 (+) Transcript_30521:98-673(+)
MSDFHLQNDGPSLFSSNPFADVDPSASHYRLADSFLNLKEYDDNDNMEDIASSPSPCAEEIPSFSLDASSSFSPELKKFLTAKGYSEQEQDELAWHPRFFEVFQLGVDFQKVKKDGSPSPSFPSPSFPSPSFSSSGLDGQEGAEGDGERGGEEGGAEPSPSETFASSPSVVAPSPVFSVPFPSSGSDVESS